MRRNWIPTVGMALAVWFVAWLGWINLRGSGSGAASTVTPSASVRPSGSGSASASASPSPDPAVAQVEAAAKKWVQAYMNTYKNGNTSEVDALEVKDSQAFGDAGVPLEFMNHNHKTFIVSALTCDPSSVNAFGTSATADIRCAAVGQDFTWPELKPLGQRSTSIHFSLGFILLNGLWLVNTQAT